MQIPGTETIDYTKEKDVAAKLLDMTGDGPDVGIEVRTYSIKQMFPSCRPHLQGAPSKMDNQGMYTRTAPRKQNLQNCHSIQADCNDLSRSVCSQCAGFHYTKSWIQSAMAKLNLETDSGSPNSTPHFAFMQH